MKISKLKINKLLIMCMVFIISISLAYAANNVVFSELNVNADGSDPGKEFIELYNPTSSAINIGNWKINLKSSSEQYSKTISSGSIVPAHGFFLITNDPDTEWPLNWPEPDARLTYVSLKNAGMGLQLEDSSHNIVDRVGWGDPLSITNYYEGTPLEAQNSDGKSLERKPGFQGPTCGNWIDTNDNSADFLSNPSPNPQNSDNATETPCSPEEDTTPPSSISNLHVTNVTNESITWEWNNPTDLDFFENIIFINGENLKNGSTVFATAFNLELDTEYTITVHTKDIAGNINDTNVSNTQRTLANLPKECIVDADCDVNNLFCNGQETCVDNQCQAGTPPVTDDGISCTADSCDENSDTIVNTPNNGLCNDQNVCTDDICSVTQDCVNNYNTNPCNDGLFCTENDLCSAGTCSGTPKAYGDQISCTVDSCDEVNDIIVYNPNNSICNNSLWCDGQETCNALLGCQAGTAPTVNDGIACTIDSCDENGNQILHEPNNSSCGLGFYCNVQQGCLSEASVCGNNLKQEGEVCDGSDLNNKTCQQFGYTNPETLACNQNCSGFETSGCSAVCGNGNNGNIEPGEECDDGNNIDGDGCNAQCQQEVCGDGALQEGLGEQCDDGNNNDGDGCNAICRGEFCGDNVLQPALGEQCDDGGNVDGDGCSAICENEIVDDLMINYLRGKITYDGVDAQAGTSYLAQVLSGDNAGKTYKGLVDDDNVFLKGTGNFDTADQLMLSTSALFRVTANNCNDAYEGTFENGGNEGIILDCAIPPEIIEVFHVPNIPHDLENATVKANVTDNIGVDKVFVYYSVNDSINQSLKMTSGSLYSANLGTFSYGDIVEYYIWANDTYGSKTTSSVHSFTVITYDADKDGFNNSVDCNDFDNTIYPGADETLYGPDNIDQNCVNDAPILVSDIPNQVWAEDTSLIDNFDLDDYFNDYDDATTLSYSFSITNPINVSIDGDNNVSFTQPKNWNGIEYAVFTAFDGINSTRSNNVTLNVIPVNDAPVANAQDAITDEDKSINITLTGSDVENEPLSFIIVSNPLNGSLNINGGNAIYTPNANFNGQDSFAFKANDGNADSNAAVVNITVNAVNDAPVANAQDAITDEDKSINITLTGSDVENEPLSFIIVSNPLNGSLNINGGNAIYTPNANFNGQDSFAFKANDGNADSNAAVVDITVNAVNDAPKINNFPNNFAIDEDTALSFQVNASDVEGDDLEYNVDSPLAAINSSGFLTFTPELNFNGIVNLTVNVSDAQDYSSGTAQVTVNSVNDVPVIDTINDIVFDEEGYNDSVDLDLYVDDVETADEDIAWSYSNGANLIINIDETTHILNISADEDWYGTRNITLTATDEGGASSDVNVIVIVNNVNDAPYFTTTPSVLTVIEATQYTYDANANDIDSDLSQLQFSIVNAPSGAAINSATGVFTWTPTAEQQGLNQVEIKVNDSEGGFDTQPFNLTVIPVLDIINIEINGESLEDGDALSGIEPGDILDTSFEVINRLSAEPNHEIVGINVHGFIEAFGILESTSGINLEGQETEAINYQFQVPYDVNVPAFALVLSAEGQDHYTNPRRASKTINFTINRNFHRVNLIGKEWSKDNLTCNRTASLTLTLVDTGNWTESGTVNIYNAQTNTNITKSFSLNVAQKKDIVFENINAAKVSDKETFSITIKYFENYYIIQDSIELVTSRCLNIDALSALLKTNEDQAPSWSPVDLKLYTFDNTAGLVYQIASENSALIDCNAASNGIFSCSTPASNLYGTSEISMNVGDVTEQFNVQVLSVNDAPVAYNVNAVVDEDNSVLIKLNCSDVENDSLTYSVVSNPSHGLLSGSGNSRTYEPNTNYNGADLFTYKCNDGTEDSNTANVGITVNPVLDEPAIANVNPDYDPLIGDGVTQEFSITIYDPDSVSPIISWYVDGTNQSNNNPLFTYSDATPGDYIIKVNITNATTNYEHIWNVIISKLPITTYDGTINDVDETNVDAFGNLTIFNSFGMIDFGDQTLDLSDVVDVNRYVRIGEGVIGIDSDNLPALNASATITLYDLPFPETPVIYYNAGFSLSGTNVCPVSICSNVQYNASTGTLKFDAAHFSLFWVPLSNHNPVITSAAIKTAYINETYTYDVDATDQDSDTLTYSLIVAPGNMSIDSSSGLISWIPANFTSEDVTVKVVDGRGGSATQSFTITVKERPKLVISDLDVKVNGKTDKNLKDGDTIKEEAGPEFTVEFKVKVENLFTDEQDVEIQDIGVTITILNIDDGDDLEEESDEFDLDPEDDKTVELEFEMPLEVEEDIYDVEIHAQGEDEKGKEHEIDWTLKLKVEKEKHEIRIIKSSISPLTIECQRQVSISTEIINTGAEDEDDVTLEIVSAELGINSVTTGIEVNEGTDDNSFTKLVKESISTDIESGIYPIVINAYYDSKLSDSKTLELTVKECELVKEVKEDIKEEKPKIEIIEPEVVEEEEGEPIITAPVEISFVETNQYRFLLATSIIIFLGTVVFIIGTAYMVLRE